MSRGTLLPTMLALFCFLMFAPRLRAATTPAELETEVATLMAAHHMPGLQAVVARADGTVLVDLALGVRDVATGAPMTPQTTTMVASLSKPMTMAAVMHAIEQGHLGLDDDAGLHLGYALRHPSFPSTPITVRQLLSHAASINDGSVILDYAAGDNPAALQDFVRDYFTPGSAWYPAEGPFTTAEPGTAWNYSNVGFAVLGAVVERATGQDYEAYCRAEVFTPLGMTATSWRVEGLSSDDRVLPSYWDADTGSYVSLGGEYSLPHGPAACLRTSARQYADFCRLFLNGGASLLAPPSVDVIVTPSFPAAADYQGLSWQLGANELGEPFLSHAGAEVGTHTVALVNGARRWVVVLLTSQNPRQFDGDTGLYEILAVLEDYARQRTAVLAPGDANGDGDVNVADVTAIGNAAAGVTFELAGDGDIDGDGELTPADARVLAEHLVNETPIN